MLTHLSSQQQLCSWFARNSGNILASKIQCFSANSFSIRIIIGVYFKMLLSKINVTMMSINLSNQGLLRSHKVLHSFRLLPDHKFHARVVPRAGNKDETLTEKAQRLYAEGKEAIKEKAHDALDTVKDLTGNVVDTSKDVKESGVEAAEDASTRFKEKTEETTEKASDLVHDAVEESRERLMGLREDTEETIEDIRHKTGDAVSEGKDWIDEKSSKAKEKMHSVEESAKEKMSEIMNSDDD